MVDCGLGSLQQVWLRDYMLLLLLLLLFVRLAGYLARGLFTSGESPLTW